jgi:hypothetical protein
LLATKVAPTALLVKARALNAVLVSLPMSRDYPTVCLAPLVLTRFVYLVWELKLALLALLAGILTPKVKALA